MTTELQVRVVHPVGDEHKPYWADTATILEMVDDEWDPDAAKQRKPATLKDAMEFLMDRGYVFSRVRPGKQARQNL